MHGINIARVSINRRQHGAAREGTRDGVPHQCSRADYRLLRGISTGLRAVVPREVVSGILLPEDDPWVRSTPLRLVGLRRRGGPVPRHHAVGDVSGCQGPGSGQRRRHNRNSTCVRPLRVRGVWTGVVVRIALYNTHDKPANASTPSAACER